MFAIDKEKFGLFVAKLRKEKGFTQKELAKRLSISDKAVSKWETGVSLPDISLLIPLGDLLGVSVTELLMCEKMTQGNTLKANEVESIVKTAITYADESPERAYQVKSNWIAFYGLSFLISCIGMFINYKIEQPYLDTLALIVLLCAVFGAYFCCFVKTKLPAFYDENKVNLFYDGPFRMHIPGMRLHNRNWPHIVKTIRLCMCLYMILFPIFAFVTGSIMPDTRNAVGNYWILLLFLCGLFIPIYLSGKKYE